MEVKYYSTKFKIDEFIKTEIPITHGIFSADSGSRNDLEDLFLFQTNNSDKMPFYVFNKNEIENISNVSDEPMMMEASCLAIREFDKPVLDIKNERFIPHLIVN